MRILDIRTQTVALSRYADPTISSRDLTTTLVAIVTDVYRNGSPGVGFGFSTVGRFGQTGLIRGRFGPRLLAASEQALMTVARDNLDPFRAWMCMMQDEKPGGHGERCVAVGTLDMALWDAAAKIAGKPLYEYLSGLITRPTAGVAMPVYVGGGYYFPSDDIRRVTEEVQRCLDQGYTHMKIKFGGSPLSEDLTRIEAVLSLLPRGEHLAVDAMNRYAPDGAIEAAKALLPYGLRWFEDMCDPLDFETHRQIAEIYALPLAVGETLFSVADARNLMRYGGLRPERDVLVFDPVHCYGLPEYLRILTTAQEHGWSRSAFQPHGGHLFALHAAAALGLGGSEANPHNFQPFGGFADDAVIDNGHVKPPDVPGIGFETRAALLAVEAR